MADINISESETISVEVEPWEIYRGEAPELDIYLGDWVEAPTPDPWIWGKSVWGGGDVWG